MPDNETVEAVQKMLDRMERRLDKKFDKIDERFDKVETKVEAISEITTKNAVVLEEHQRRSLANEEQLQLARQEAAARAEDIEESQKVLKAEVDNLTEETELIVKLPKMLAKVAIWLAAMAGGVGAIYGLFTWLVSVAK